MLDPWIIEEIKRRERQKNELPTVVELPIHGPDGRDHQKPTPENEDKPPRGVTIIDYGIACW